MSKVQAWMHYVWSTKNREPMLPIEIRQSVFEHILSNAREKNIYVDHIGGSIEHVHLLVSLRKHQPIDEVAKLLKGESSHWINKQSLLRGRFGWQDDYYAESVGLEYLGDVRAYIRNQEAHHRHLTFADEWERLMARMK